MMLRMLGSISMERRLRRRLLKSFCNDWRVQFVGQKYTDGRMRDDGREE